MTNAKLRCLSRLGSPLLVAVVSAGLVLGACQEDESEMQDDSDTIEISPEIVAACEDYCEKFASCNEETVAEECEEKCKGVLYACEEHQKGEALDQVEQCGGKDCFAFPLCTVNAGVQCLTGLGF